MMAKAWCARLGGAGLVLSAMALSCGGSGPPVAGSASKKAAPKVSQPAARAEVHERITAHTCPARTKLAELLGHTTPAPAPASEQSAESAPPPTSMAGTA